MLPNFGAPKIINFTFGTTGNLLFLGVPILNHITVHVIKGTNKSFSVLLIQI